MNSIPIVLVAGLLAFPPNITSFTAPSVPCEAGQAVSLAWTLTGGAPGTLTLVGPPGPQDGGEQGGGSFRRPMDLAVDSGGNLFVTDALESTVRKIARDGSTTVIAGTPDRNGSQDGEGSQASFQLPWGIAVDSQDNLIVADRGAHTIRRVSPTGFVETLAGQAGTPGWEDGTGAHARFNGPQGVVVDAFDNIFVADTDNATVRKITPDGAVTTVAGVPGQPGVLLGPLPGALSRPASVTVTPAGDLLVQCAKGIIQITAP